MSLLERKLSWNEPLVNEAERIIQYRWLVSCVHVAWIDGEFILKLLLPWLAVLALDAAHHLHVAIESGFLAWTLCTLFVHVEAKAWLILAIRNHSRMHHVYKSRLFVVLMSINVLHLLRRLLFARLACSIWIRLTEQVNLVLTIAFFIGLSRFYSLSPAALREDRLDNWRFC